MSQSCQMSVFHWMLLIWMMVKAVKKKKPRVVINWIYPLNTVVSRRKEPHTGRDARKSVKNENILTVISMNGVLGKLQSFPRGRHKKGHVSWLVGCASREQSLPLTPAKSAEFSSHSPRNLCKSSCAKNKSLIRALHTTQTNSLFISDCKHKVPQL